jgi:DNA polymerase III subunit delta
VTPAQLAARLKKGEFAPAYVFAGPEAYQRRQLKQLLIDTVLGEDGRENGLTQYDLGETDLSTILDDARSLSLFATDRVIYVTNAEAALPRGKAAAAEDDGEGEGGGSGDAAPLAAYLQSPTPGVVLVFEAIRYELEGEDKKKLERVLKFYSAVPQVVEMARFRSDDARAEAQALVKKAGFAITPDALELLIEALGADIARIDVEIQKLALYANGRTVGVDDIPALVPDARATTIFALVNALGRRNRAQALLILDTLTKEGEYLPLALAFLSTQFRMALVAREAGLKSAQQIQGHFSRLGVPMWGSRAEQVYQTTSKFSTAQLMRAMQLIFEADKGLRSARPDDRVVMEQFVLRLTA